MSFPLPGFLHRWLTVRGNQVAASRRYDFPVGGHNDPYMLRWWVIPRNPIFNIYLHHFLRDDEDRALHDHPWLSCSIILTAGYYEHLSETVKVWRSPGTVHFRRAKAKHRISLERDYCGLVELPCGESFPTQSRRPAMTLFITGPRIRRWGFHCPRGWVHWKEFVAPEDKGSVGRGCGEL